MTFVLINRKKNKINQFGMDLFYYLGDNTVAISTFTVYRMIAKENLFYNSVGFFLSPDPNAHLRYIAMTLCPWHSHC